MQELKDEINALRGVMSKLLETCNEQKELLKDIDKVVRLGNGKPPLVERVALLENNVTENRGFITRVMTAFGVAVVGLIGAVTTFIQSH